MKKTHKTNPKEDSNKETQKYLKSIEYVLMFLGVLSFIVFSYGIRQIEYYTHWLTLVLVSSGVGLLLGFIISEICKVKITGFSGYVTESRTSLSAWIIVICMFSSFGLCCITNQYFVKSHYCKTFEIIAVKNYKKEEIKIINAEDEDEWVPLLYNNKPRDKVDLQINTGLWGFTFYTICK